MPRGLAQIQGFENFIHKVKNFVHTPLFHHFFSFNNSSNRYIVYYTLQKITKNQCIKIRMQNGAEQINEFRAPSFAGSSRAVNHRPYEPYVRVPSTIPVNI